VHENLRAKVEPDPRRPRYLVTEAGWATFARRLAIQETISLAEWLRQLIGSRNERDRAPSISVSRLQHVRHRDHEVAPEVAARVAEIVFATSPTRRYAWSRG